MKHIEHNLFDDVEARIDRSNSLIKQYREREREISSKKLSVRELKYLKRAKRLMLDLRLDKDEQYNHAKKILKSLVLDMFYLDLASFSVLTEIKNAMATEGADVEQFDTRMLTRNLEKFKELYFVHHLYNGLGLSVLEDDVLQAIVYGERRDKTGELISAIKRMVPARQKNSDSKPEGKSKKEAKIEKPKKSLTFQDLHRELNPNT